MMTHTLRNMAAALMLLAATAVQAQTLTTVKVEKEVTGSNAEVTISMDWPVSGKQKLVDGVRNYIVGVLRAQNNVGKRYTGDPANGQAIATFYAKELQKSLAEDAAYEAAQDGYERFYSMGIFFSKKKVGTTAVTYTLTTNDSRLGNYGHDESSVTFNVATGKPVKK